MLLSTELFDHILSFLQPDPVSLKACSESHPLLSRLVERHQFLHLELHHDHNYKFMVYTRELCGLAFSEFVKILRDRPHIAKYVRSLEVDVGPTPLVLADILPTLTLLEKANFVGLGGCRWQALPVHFHRVFLDCLHSPSMEDVCISHVEGFPLSALNDCKSLRRLTLDQCNEPCGSLDVTVSRELSLESLAIQDCGIESLLSIIAWAPTCNLRSLEVSDRGKGRVQVPFHKLPPFLAKYSNTLTSLGLAVNNRFLNKFTTVSGSNLNNHSEICFPFTLSTLPHLERFTVCARVYFHFDESDSSDAEGFSSPIPAIIHALKTISPHVLKRLTLNFRFRTKCFRPLPPGDVVWAPLVRLVAESRLPSIHLNVVPIVFHDSIDHLHLQVVQH